MEFADVDVCALSARPGIAGLVLVARLVAIAGLVMVAVQFALTFCNCQRCVPVQGWVSFTIKVTVDMIIAPEELGLGPRLGLGVGLGLGLELGLGLGTKLVPALLWLVALEAFGSELVAIFPSLSCGSSAAASSIGLMATGYLILSTTFTDRRATASPLATS